MEDNHSNSLMKSKKLSKYFKKNELNISHNGSIQDKENFKKKFKCKFTHGQMEMIKREIDINVTAYKMPETLVNSLFVAMYSSLFASLVTLIGISITALLDISKEFLPDEKDFSDMDIILEIFSKLFSRSILIVGLVFIIILIALAIMKRRIENKTNRMITTQVLVEECLNEVSEKQVVIHTK